MLEKLRIILAKRNQWHWLCKLPIILASPILLLVWAMMVTIYSLVTATRYVCYEFWFSGEDGNKEEVIDSPDIKDAQELSRIYALKWEVLMQQRVAFSTILWNRIAVFSLVSSILITASFIETISDSQRLSLAISGLGLVLAFAFYLINIRHDAYFSAIEKGIRSAETNLRELNFLTELNFQWHQKTPIRYLVYMFPLAFFIFWIIRAFGT